NPAFENVFQVPGGNLDHPHAILGSGEATAELVERARLRLAMASCPGLISHALRESADHDRDEEHHRECHTMANVPYGKRPEGRDEDEIEGSNARKRGYQRWTEAVSARDEHDPEQIRHHHVRQLIPTEKQIGGRRRDGGGKKRGEVTRDFQGGAHRPCGWLFVAKDAPRELVWVFAPVDHCGRAYAIRAALFPMWLRST